MCADTEEVLSTCGKMHNKESFKDGMDSSLTC